MERLYHLIAAVWLGSAVFLMLSSAAAFRAAGSATVAADVVGAMLTRWHYIALAAPLALFALELRNPRRVIITVVFAALLLAAAQSFVDLRIRAIRYSSPGPVSQLPAGDPLRRRFGMLHGASMLLLVLQALSAAVVVAAREKPRHEVVDLEEELQDTTIYKVVANQEGHYSIWPVHRESPAGWNDAGFAGSRDACVAHIDAVRAVPTSPGDDSRVSDDRGGGPVA